MPAPQPRTRQILLVTALTAVLTAGGTGLASAYAEDSPEPVESGYMIVDGATRTDDCPEQGAATLTYPGAQL